MELELVESHEKPKLDFMTWMNTEGGRKCPQCGRYAKADDLGWIGVSTGQMVVDVYGHKNGCPPKRSRA